MSLNSLKEQTRTKPGHIHEEPDVSWSEMPDGVRENIILRRAIWPRMNVHNNNWVAILTGETGSGKSWGAIRLAEILDPEFSVDQVAFNVEEFLDLASDKSYPDGSVIVLEEAGVAANARNWYDVANEVLNFVLQTWRHQNRGAIITAPELDLIDKQVRRRFHHYIEMVAKDEQENRTRGDVRYIDTDRMEGDNYFWHHRFKAPDGVVRRYRYIDFQPPTEDVREAYETAKDDYTSKLNERLLNELREETPDPEEDIGPKQAAERIIGEGRIEEFIDEVPSGEYISRDLLKLDFDLTDNESKQTKALLKREVDRDLM